MSGCTPAQLFADLDGVYDIGTNPGPINLSQLDSDYSKLVGGHIGFNFQKGSIVFGVEADLSSAFGSERMNAFCFAGGCTSTNLSASIDKTFSVRGRLGFASDKVLVYGTVGWAGADYDFSAVQTPKVDTGPNGKRSFHNRGLVYGGGLEYALDRVTFRAEYLHYDTGFRYGFFDEELVDIDVGDTIKFSGTDVVRVGVSFRLGS